MSCTGAQRTVKGVTAFGPSNSNISWFAHTGVPIALVLAHIQLDCAALA